MAQALGMRVVASSSSKPLGRRPDGIEVVSYGDLLSSSDFVSVHCPLNSETKGLVDAEAISKMKQSAYIINTARGGIIHQESLVSALRERRIAGAALDVFGERSFPRRCRARAHRLHRCPLTQDSPLHPLLRRRIRAATATAG
jgi:phosphoglycerate dehydrogenase-like enzyme